MLTLFQFTFPNNEDSPPELAKLSNMNPITSRVFPYFFVPVRLICFRLTASSCARVTVPEATMDKDKSFELRKN